MEPSSTCDYVNQAQTKPISIVELKETIYTVVGGMNRSIQKVYINTLS